MEMTNLFVLRAHTSRFDRTKNGCKRKMDAIVTEVKLEVNWGDTGYCATPWKQTSYLFKLQRKYEDCRHGQHTSRWTKLSRANNANIRTFSPRLMYPWFSANQVFLLLTSVPPQVTSADVHVTLHAMIIERREVLEVWSQLDTIDDLFCLQDYNLDWSKYLVRVSVHFAIA